MPDSKTKKCKKMLIEKTKYLTDKHLFQFSYNCKKVPINKTLKYLPFDLKHNKYYHLTSFYVKNVLRFFKRTSII